MKIIYCAGELGKVVLDIICAKKYDEPICFIDDNQCLHETNIKEYKIIGGIEALKKYNKENVSVIIAFGDQPGIRTTLANKTAQAGYQFFSAIHPNTTVSNSVETGNGIIINAESYVGPDVIIKDHVLIDSCVNISHDVEIGRGSILTPGSTLAGGVNIGRDAYIGPGSTITENINIGDGSIVGAGAVVTENVCSDTTVVGVPAKPIK